MTMQSDIKQSGTSPDVSDSLSGDLVPIEFKLFKTKDEIAQCVNKIGREISAWLSQIPRDERVIAMPIMRGALFFGADLLRSISSPVQISPYRVKSYDVTTNKQLTKQEKLSDFDVEVRGRRILLIDDICDTGITLHRRTKTLKELGVKEVRSCVLIRREIPEVETFEPEYVGIHYSGPEFFVGYGLDNMDLWRNTPDLYTIEPVIPDTK